MPVALLMQGKEQQPFLGINSDRKRLLRDPHDAKRGTLSVALFFHLVMRMEGQTQIPEMHLMLHEEGKGATSERAG